MRKVIGILACLGLLAGCEQQTAAAPANAPAQAAANELSGKVIETIDVSSYTYLRLATAAGETWAAIPATDVQKGAEVVVLEPKEMGPFESKTLHRKFDNIFFGAGIQGGVPKRSPPSMPMMAGVPSMPSMPAAPAAQAIKVERAPGGRTVAEIFKDKKGLSGTTVSVRGQVVKWNEGILGRNWLHVRDGSGTTEGADSDLVVTTQDSAQVGDVVVVKGTVHLDKDFGAGYAYPVIIEEASLSR